MFWQSRRQSPQSGRDGVRYLAAWAQPFARLAIAWALIGFAIVAHAATVERMQVERQGKAYQVTARIHLDVPREAAFKAATDFKRLPDYSPMIEATRLLSHRKLSSRMRLCVLAFCKTVRQIMRYHMRPPKRLDMHVVPGKGDLSAGGAHWRFLVDGTAETMLLFDASVTPAFWVPPLIGPWLIARKLREQAASTATAIESLARKRAGISDRATP